MEWPFYVVAFVALAIPLGLLFAAAAINSVGLGILGLIVGAVVIVVAINVLAQLGSDL